jgi:hypothetical protein
MPRISAGEEEHRRRDFLRFGKAPIFHQSLQGCIPPARFGGLPDNRSTSAYVAF